MWWFGVVPAGQILLSNRRRAQCSVVIMATASGSSKRSSGRALPALPLRLAAEPYGRSLFPSSVALGIHHSPSSQKDGGVNNLDVAAIVDDDGIRAFALSAPISRRVLLELLEYPRTDTSTSTTNRPDGSSSRSVNAASAKWMHGPILCLVRTAASSNDMEWHVFAKDEEFPSKQDDVQAHTKVAFHDPFIAKLLTESIRLYYAQQVLEPSVRGFLSVLEKQFARSDLYLFELLQNAVDDGASEIHLSVAKSSSGGGGGLSFRHNGRAFTPLDVLGLSSVGLSTKTREGKRTIGFMGVGFKACYKRFSRVKIDDGIYKFAYERPPDDAGYGWVMQPIWTEESSRAENSTMNGSMDSNASSWCQFSLERPVGGVQSVEKDLSVLPQTAPPLLGRAALEKRWNGSECNESDTWTLDWNAKVYRINRTRLAPLSGVESGAASFHIAADRSEVVAVQMTDQAGHTSISRWLFVSHKYTPSAQAAKSYQAHTKRTHSGQEEVCGFVRLGGDGGLTPLFRATARTGATLGGIVHSVLPTKLRMPMPLNIQGPWLLSVDRQEVQDLGDNMWNTDLVLRLPILIVNIFRWAASEHLSTAKQYSAICNLLPMLSVGSSTSSLSTEFLGQSVSLDALARAMYTERILPVALPANGMKKGSIAAADNNTAADEMDIDEPAPQTTAIVTGYYEGKRSVWVPPSFLAYLSSEFLRGWLGRRPLRTDLLGGAAYHPIFASPDIIGQLNIIQQRRDHLSREVGAGAGKLVNDDVVQKLVSLMAAIGAAYLDHPDHANLPSMQHTQDRRNKPKNDKRTSPVPSNSSDSAQAGPSLPEAAASWPIFLTADGTISTLKQVVLPDDGFATVPENLRSILRPFLLGSVIESGNEGGREKNRRDFRGRGKSQNKQKGRGGSRSPPPQPQKSLLHPLLETEIFRLDTQEDLADDGLTTNARHFIARARAEAPPSNTISVAAAASHCLASYSYANVAELSSEQVATVLDITEYALRIDDASLISHVLVDRPSTGRPCLVPAQESYIGKALDEAGRGGDLDTFSKGSLHFVSSAYTSIASSDRQNLLKLFDKAGVQSGLSAEVTAIIDVDKADRQLLTSEILPKLPSNTLPQTRKSTTKGAIYLPYNLEIPVDKRKYYLLDAQLPIEWERIVRDMSPTCAVGFISLLLGMPFDTAIEVSSKNTPAVADFLAGVGRSDSEVIQTVNTKNGNPSRGRKSARIAKNSAVPLRRRFCFLPPGQVGAIMFDPIHIHLLYCRKC